MERLIPISKKQHEAITGLSANITAARDRLTTVSETILLGLEEDLGPVSIIGGREQDGGHFMVIDVPDAPNA